MTQSSGYTLGEGFGWEQRKVSLPWLEFWRTLTEIIQSYGYSFLVYENVGRVARALDTLGECSKIKYSTQSPEGGQRVSQSIQGVRVG